MIIDGAPVRLLDKRLFACLFVLQVIVTARLGPRTRWNQAVNRGIRDPQSLSSSQERGERPILLQCNIELPCSGRTCQRAASAYSRGRGKRILLLSEGRQAQLLLRR